MMTRSKSSNLASGVSQDGTSCPDLSQTTCVTLSLAVDTAPSVADAKDNVTAPSVSLLDSPILAHTLTHLVLGSLENGQGGVPTRTTPTLTPTTLRNIEQTFLNLVQIQPPEKHSNQAGFVPPPVQPSSASTFVSVDNKSLGGGIATVSPTPSSSTLEHTQSPQPTMIISTASSPAGPPPLISTRKMGGRRPAKDEKLTPEEEDRRRIRRERNKMAAARCRKRRLDQTVSLQEETNKLEEDKSELQKEIALLQQQKDELQFLLDTHKSTCPRSNVSRSAVITSLSLAEPASVMSTNQPVKEEPLDAAVLRKNNPLGQPTKPKRPTFLAISQVDIDLGASSETPPSLRSVLNLDSMMECSPCFTSSAPFPTTSTGLTPLVTPTLCVPSQSVVNCSSQQRSSSDMASPDSLPPKLVSL